MARHLIVIAAFLSLAVPTALAVPPADKDKPEKNKPAKTEKSESATSQASDQNPAKKCKAERASLGVEAFENKYGTNHNKANAFGKCVSGSKVKKDKAKEEKDESDDEAETEAEKNAAEKCKAERALIGAEAFKNKYGTNHNKANAFGKCVSKLAKAQTS